MKVGIHAFGGLVLGMVVAGSACAVDVGASPPATQPAQTIQVCFVLDTTGSMGGLIEGAKAKIWSIANDIIAGKPKPHLQVALLPYRDRGDQYITKLFDLTDDLDEVFKNLQTFKADGGGDGPESVNQALAEAVEKVGWSADKQVSKIIFLVGDAPPHMDYENDVRYPDTCKAAVKKDLMIDTVQCGNQGDTAAIWQEIARSAEGSYVQLGQSGDMVAMATPMDKELAELNVAINKTVIAYGLGGQQHAVREKLARSEAAAPAVTAGRVSYNYYDGAKAVQGDGDLVMMVSSGAIAADKLQEDQLSEELKKMTPEQRKEYIGKQQSARQELQKKVAELVKQRDAYIVTERARLARDHKADSFDEKVAEIVAEQAARRR